MVNVEGSLSADLIAQQNFGAARRGFDPDEVRAFLVKVAAEIVALHERQAALEDARREAEYRAAHPSFDEDTLLGAVGDETAHILKSAHEAAGDIKNRAEENASRILKEAHQQAEALRGQAETVLARRTEEAEAIAGRIKEASRAEGERLVDQARQQSKAIRAQAEAERNAMVEGAQATREKILSALSRKRNVAVAQVEQLRAGRERLLESYQVVRRTLDEATSELARAESEARAAADAVRPRPLALDEPDGLEDDTEPTNPTLPIIQNRMRQSSVGEMGAGSPGRTPGQPTPGRTVTADAGAAPPIPARSGQARSGTAPWVASQGAAPRDSSVPAGASSTRAVTPSAPSSSAAGPTVPGAADRDSSGSGPARSGPADSSAASAGQSVSAAVRTGTSGAGTAGSGSVGAGGSGSTAARSVAPASAMAGSGAAGSGTAGSGTAGSSPAGARGAGSGASGSAVAGSGVAGSPGVASGGSGPATPVGLASTRGPSTGTGPTTAAAAAAAAKADSPLADGGRVVDVAAGENPVSPRSGPIVATVSPPSDTVESLFARIRADRDRAVAQTREVLAEDRPVPDEDEALLQRRDEVVGPIEANLTRRLKRALQDDQNDLLDRLRGLRSSQKAVAVVLSSRDAHTARFREAGRPFLRDAVTAGVAFTASLLPGVRPSEHLGGLDHLADDLADAIVEPLRRRLESVLAAGEGDDPVVLAEAVGGAYREWKTKRVEVVAADHVAAAFATAAYAATPAATLQRWLVEDTGGPCPDCDDNVLAGEQPKGEPFPTGQRHPPAHAGCRCLLVPFRG